MTSPQYDPSTGQPIQDPTQYGQAPGGYGQPPMGYWPPASGYGQGPGPYGQPTGSGPGFGIGNPFGRGGSMAYVARRRGMTQIIIGAVIFIVGIVITIATYSSASSSSTGGTYIVAYGPMILGVITIVRGVAALIRAKRLS